MWWEEAKQCPPCLSPEGQQMALLCKERGRPSQAPRRPTKDGSLVPCHCLALGHQLSLNHDFPWGVKDGHTDDFLHSRTEDRGCSDQIAPAGQEKHGEDQGLSAPPLASLPPWLGQGAPWADSHLCLTTRSPYASVSPSTCELLKTRDWLIHL